MKVEVTQEDIDKGDKHPWSCPIARAILRTYGLPIHKDQRELAVCGDMIFFGKYIEQWKTPLKVKRFVTRFDSGAPVKPFTFSLRGVKWQPVSQ